MSKHNTLLVGLTGPAGCGKDTAATYLELAFSARGHRCYRLAFADPIRAMLAQMGVPTNVMQQRSLKEQPLDTFCGASYRKLAQTLGTEWGRHLIGHDLWLRVANARIGAVLERYQRPRVVIVSDVRFPDEAQWITQGIGGVRGAVVRVLRPDTQPVRLHESEQQLLLADHELHNDADLPNLSARCGRLADMLMAEAELEA